MTAIERIERAATEAGLIVTAEGNTVRASTEDGQHSLTIEADSLGRLTAGCRRENGRGRGVMPAAGLETRAMAWLDLHRVDTTIPAAADVFAELERNYEAEDAFAQGGASGLAQLDERRRMPRTPHTFEGRSDRPCEVTGCGLADRHPIHAASTLRADYRPTGQGAPGDLVVVRVEPDVFEVRQHGETISFLGAEAESLRDQLVELLGPAPTDR